MPSELRDLPVNMESWPIKTRHSLYPPSCLLAAHKYPRYSWSEDVYKRQGISPCPLSLIPQWFEIRYAQMVQSALSRSSLAVSYTHLVPVGSLLPKEKRWSTPDGKHWRTPTVPEWRMRSRKKRAQRKPCRSWPKDRPFRFLRQDVYKRQPICCCNQWQKYIIRFCWLLAILVG